MKKRIFALLFMLISVVSFSSCGEKQEEKTVNENAPYEETEKPAENESPKEEKVETIYAKTPEEAAEKYLAAVYSGNIDDAKHYVSQDADVFEELDAVKNGIMQGMGIEEGSKLTEKAEKFVSNIFSKVDYRRESVNETGETATVTYSVTTPDMTNIDYSLHIDSYMAANGISQETLMMELEGMTEQEMEEWSKEFGLDVMNYIFENDTEYATVTETTTIHLEKGKNGWIVTKMDNLT